MHIYTESNAGWIWKIILTLEITMYALRQVTRMSLRLSRNLPRAMATGTTPASQAISEAAKAEGGPQKGSLSASMQSQVGRTQNFEQAAAEVGQSMALLEAAMPVCWRHLLT